MYVFRFMTYSLGCLVASIILPKYLKINYS